jgi:hypothetical protein
VAAHGAHHVQPLGPDGQISQHCSRFRPLVRGATLRSASRSCSPIAVGTFWAVTSSQPIPLTPRREPSGVGRAGWAWRRRLRVAPWRDFRREPSDLVPRPPRGWERPPPAPRPLRYCPPCLQGVAERAPDATANQISCCRQLEVEGAVSGDARSPSIDSRRPSASSRSSRRRTRRLGGWTGASRTSSAVWTAGRHGEPPEEGAQSTPRGERPEAGVGIAAGAYIEAWYSCAGERSETDTVSAEECTPRPSGPARARPAGALSVLTWLGPRFSRARRFQRLRESRGHALKTAAAIRPSTHP